MESHHAHLPDPAYPTCTAPRRTSGEVAPPLERHIDHRQGRPPAHRRQADPPPARWMAAVCTETRECLALRHGKTGEAAPFRVPESGTNGRNWRLADRWPGRCAGWCGWATGGQALPPQAKQAASTLQRACRACVAPKTGPGPRPGRPSAKAPALQRDTGPGSCAPSSTAGRFACQILTGASTGVKPAKKRRGSASMATLVIWSELCVSPLAYGRGGWCPGSRSLLPSCWWSLQHGGGRGTARPGLGPQRLPHRQTLAAVVAEAVPEMVRSPPPSRCLSAWWTGAMCVSSSVP